MPPSEGLEITGAAAAAQDPKHRHEQQKPLGITHPTAVAAIRDGLEETDQIIGISLIDCSIWGVGHGGEPFPPTKANADRPDQNVVDTLLGGPALLRDLLRGLPQEVLSAAVPLLIN